MIRDRSIAALLAGELVSRLGSQLTYLALPWFVLVTTGSPTRMTLVFAAQLVPMALLGIPAGSVVHRLGPKTSMLIADGARAPIIALVPFLHEVGGLTFGLILVVAALNGVFSCAYFTCQRLILPAVVGEDEQQLAQANSLVEGATNVTQLLGPALAGVLIAALGAANVMWLDAASFLLAFVLIAAFVRVGRESFEDDAEAGGILAGLRYLRRDALVLRASISSLMFGFLFPMLTVSFPVLAYTQYDHNPRVAGLLLSAIGGGQVVGSIARLPARDAGAADAHGGVRRDRHRGTALAAGAALAALARRDRARDLRCLDPDDQRAVPRDAVDPHPAGAPWQGDPVADHHQPAGRSGRAADRGTALRPVRRARRLRDRCRARNVRKRQLHPRRCQLSGRPAA